ncbi:hypothetical protein [Streptomyces mirabilis]|uniref:hypothetical protein n=1 Tax=Streptomyces mirabilis TaxID=68239 RepID=UPI0036CEE3B4
MPRHRGVRSASHGHVTPASGRWLAPDRRQFKLQLAEDVAEEARALLKAKVKDSG